MLREARESLPELPEARMRRYREELGLAEETASAARRRPRAPPTTSSGAAAAEGVEPQVAANWVTGELAAALRQAGGEEAPGRVEGRSRRRSRR